MLFAADKPFSNYKLTIIKRLCSTFSHAWLALEPKRKVGARLSRKWMAMGLTVLAALIGCIPVPLSVVAPMEVVARNPVIVASPLTGVIEDVLVAPDEAVEKGDVLLRFNELELRSRFELAQRDLGVVNARLRRASQSSFGSGEGRSELATLKNEAEVARARMGHAAELLSRTEMLADRVGVVLFGSRDEWIGRPVVTGERIMQIADPSAMELKIEVATSDSAILSQVEHARAFLDSDPMAPVTAKVVRKSYAPRRTEAGTLAYEVVAQFRDPQKRPANGIRIGIRGTAHLTGKPVPLAYNLFRKPLSAIRQYIGF